MHCFAFGMYVHQKLEICRNVRFERTMKISRYEDAVRRMNTFSASESIMKGLDAENRFLKIRE